MSYESEKDTLTFIVNQKSIHEMIMFRIKMSDGNSETRKIDNFGGNLIHFFC